MNQIRVMMRSFLKSIKLEDKGGCSQYNSQFEIAMDELYKSLAFKKRKGRFLKITSPTNPYKPIRNKTYLEHHREEKTNKTN